MAFRDVQHSFPADVTVGVPAPPPVAPVLAPVGFGLGAPMVLAPAPAPPYVVSLELHRTAESTQVQPGYGLAPLTLAPLDAATGLAPAAFAFGTQSASFNRVNPPVNGTVEPFLLCPGDGTPVAVRWVVRHAAPGITAVLELFRQGRAMPIWTRQFGNAGGVNLQNTVAWAPPGGAAANCTYYEATFNGNVTAAGAGILPDPSGTFAGGWLDAEHGPYKFMLTVLGAGAPAYRAAWTYFHVPAHKFKLVRYVPSTEMGCFGMEFDPASNDVKVINRAYFGYEAGAVPIPPAFPMGGMNLHVPLCARLFKDWSAQYYMRVGGKDYRPLCFVIPRGGVQVPTIVGNQSDYGATIAPLTRAATGDFPVVLRNANGGSGVVPAAEGAFLRLYALSAFLEDEPAAARKVQTFEKDMATVRAGIEAAMGTAPGNIGYEQDVDYCSVIVGMPEGSVDPDPATLAWLPTLAAALNGKVPLLSGAIQVLFSSFGKNGRPANGKRNRQTLSRVKARVAPALTAPPGGAPVEAAERREAAAGYQIGADVLAAGTGGARVVRIDFGRRPGTPLNVGGLPPFPYTASVHEFGHVFGFPDEYMDYKFPLNGCLSLWRSQPRIDQLAAAFGVATANWPVGNTSNINPNLMSMGTVFHERYYLTFAEALSKLLFLGAANTPAIQGRPPRNHNAAGMVMEDPAFTPVTNLLRGAADAFEAAAGPPLETRADLRARVVADAALAPVTQIPLYLVDTDSDAVVAALATGFTDRRHFVQTAIRVDDECLHGAIQVEALRAITKLDTAGPVLLNYVPFPAAGAGRVKVNLRALRAFAGSGRLILNPGGVVDAYTLNALGALVNPGLAGTVLNGGGAAGQLGHAAGMDVWLQGVAQGVTDLTLELYNAGGNLIAQSEIAKIVCGPPVEALIDKEPIGADLAMPLQGCANSTFEYTAIRLRKRAPMGGALCRIDKVVAGGAAGDFTVHLAQGGPAQVLPYDMPNASYNAAEEVDIFLAGTHRSAAAGDASLTLAIAGAAVFTTVNVTVVEVVDLQISLTDSAPFTARTVGYQAGIPPRTSAVAPANPNAAVNRLYRPHLATHGFLQTTAPPLGVPPARRANYGSDDFAVNFPLVLVEGSMPAPGGAEVTATVHPQGIVATWDIERDEDDNDRLATLAAAPLPAIVAGAAAPAGPDLNFPVTVPTDNVGSFHLRLLMNNGRDEILTLNLVQVRARARNADESRASVPRRHVIVAKKMAAPHAGAGDQHLAVTTGTWTGVLNQPTESTFGCVLRGEVHLIGGGADGRLGQDCVFAGWIQNIVQFTVSGRYVDSAPGAAARVVAMGVVSNQVQGAPRVNNDYYFVNGGAAAAALDVLAVPGQERMLDTGRAPAGGSSILLSQSVAGAPANDDTLGWRMVASAADSPGTEYFLRHPARPSAFLTRMDYRHEFHSVLSVWADGAAPGLGAVNAGNTSHGAGNRVFACCGDLRWRVVGAWTVQVANGAWSGLANVGVAVQANRVNFHRVADLDLSIHQPFAPYPAAVPADNLVEVKSPSMLAAFSWGAVW